MKKNLLPALLLLLSGLFAGGCSQDNPLAPFEPEIVNDADAFQFQITGATDVTVTRSYTWANPAAGATIDHSTFRTDGSATVVLYDADGTEVYRSALKASGLEQSDPGVAGNWVVKIILSSFDGTANFRVEKMEIAP